MQTYTNTNTQDRETQMHTNTHRQKCTETQMHIGTNIQSTHTYTPGRLGIYPRGERATQAPARLPLPGSRGRPPILTDCESLVRVQQRKTLRRRDQLVAWPSSKRCLWGWGLRVGVRGPPFEDRQACSLEPTQGKGVLRGQQLGGSLPAGWTHAGPRGRVSGHS